MMPADYPIRNRAFPGPLVCKWTKKIQKIPMLLHSLKKSSQQVQCKLTEKGFGGGGGGGNLYLTLVNYNSLYIVK